jgi:hypothetical protein
MPRSLFSPLLARLWKLPAGTVDILVKPENKAQMTGIEYRECVVCGSKTGEPEC